ncbi:MAG TPA: response regulator transcription factor [Candidatus Eisenbacteria bacterium]|nr:response regulator transcription factor [Candidatus Eisenbacteria bacterium]
MIKVLIADDHPIFRQGLKEILRARAGVDVVGEAETGQKALELARKERWDAVVLDIAMPGIGGIEALRLLKQERPRLPVLVLTNHAEDQYGVRALRAGADGYLTKDKAPQELLNALSRLLQGGKYIGPTLAEELAAKLSGAGRRSPHEILSDREYDIMRRIALGKPLFRIARELGLSPRTVSTYRARLLRKMQMKTNTDLIRYALEKKLIG